MRAILRTGLNLAVLGALLPPLEQSPGLTSGFGEYRDGGRFHAGLDYSTAGRTGLPVRAVADGWVERVRTSGVGYGRSVYLRLADGRTAVYGHLSGFATALDTWVAVRQDSSGLYEQDLFPPAGLFTFRRGDVLAFSGESGAGPPHLHFEVRRGDMNLHPMRQGIRVVDRTPPSIASVRIAPASTATRIDGGLDAWGGSWGTRGRELAGPDVTGPFHLVLDTWDRVGARANHLATYRLRVRVDGELRYDAVLDSVSWDDMAVADRVFDLAGTLAGETDRRALQSTPGDRSGVVRRGAPAWTLKAGEHRLEFEAGDEAGNVTRRTLRLTAGRQPAETAGDAARSSLLPPESHPGARITPLGSEVVIGVPDSPSWVLPPTDWNAQALDSMRISGGRLWSVPLEPGTLLPVPPVKSALAFRAAEDSPRVALGAVMGLPWESIVLEWGVGTFFEEPALVVERKRGGAKGSVGFMRTPEHVLLIEPTTLALGKPVILRWTPGGAVDARRLGLFRRTPRRWSFLTGPDSTGTFVASTRRLGGFALLADTTAPKIVPPASYSPRTGENAPVFNARVTDEGAGLTASGLFVRLDGRRVPAEYDPESDRLIWRPRTALAPGAHEIVIEATDALGNRSSVRVPVAVR